MAVALMILRRPRRGHAALRRAVVLARRDPTGGEAALRELTTRELPTAIRLEAAGRLAAAALDRGALAEAVAILETVDGPAEDPRPARALGLGLIGELMRSLATRLGTSRFRRCAESSALAPGNPQAPANEDDRDSYLALLGVLELLEAEAGAPQSVLEAAWRRVQASSLERRFPGIALIADAAVSARLPAARSAIEARLAAGDEPSRWTRTTLAGLFPELVASLGEQGYRSPAREAAALATMNRWRPPAAIAELLADHEDGTTARVSERLGRVLSLGAGPLAAGAMALGGPLPLAGLGLAGLLGVGIQRKLRARPVAAMPYGPTASWLREIAEAPDAPAPLGDRSAPLRRDQLELYLSCVRAEQELARGDIEAAWDWVAWWFADRDYRRAPRLSLFPVASSLLRVACLSGHNAEARSLAEVLEPGPSWRGRLARRTVFGDAPRALAHARCVVYTRVGAFSEAARALEGAASLPRVIVSERDEVLHVLVALKVAKMVPGIDPRLCAYSPQSLARVRPWLERVWPQLVHRAG